MHVWADKQWALALALSCQSATVLLPQALRFPAGFRAHTPSRCARIASMLTLPLPPAIAAASQASAAGATGSTQRQADSQCGQACCQCI